MNCSFPDLPDSPDRAARHPGQALLVDLSAVEYLDSAGLSVLFAHAPRIELVANDPLAPVLTISGLVQVTTVHGIES
ncbi:hypothetical protein OG320_12315 [Microbispora sp. NBC_01189]|uniref:hypothetical protein n=1 Tax=Microbispora sp. NBC_01189 TaxID=2903583 RepID=UPI002E1427B1|nr:hypothetical protein OG320_12315 [Microbispora sp. NBC_01189]